MWGQKTEERGRRTEEKEKKGDSQVVLPDSKMEKLRLSLTANS